jgi:hypothetical protein
MPQGRRFPKSDNIQRHRSNHACAYSYFHGKQNSTTCSIIRVIPDYKDFISFLRGLIYYLTVLVQCCRFSYFLQSLQVYHTALVHRGWLWRCVRICIKAKFFCIMWDSCTSAFRVIEPSLNQWNKRCTRLGCRSNYEIANIKIASSNVNGEYWFATCSPTNRKVQTKSRFNNPKCRKPNLSATYANMRNDTWTLEGGPETAWEMQ